MRTRRLLVPLCGLALLAACGHTVVGRSPDPGDAAQAWVRLPDPPLSARSGPVVAWDGSRVLVVGGDQGPPCPPNASCARSTHLARDGAAYDVVARSWHSLSPAPVGISPGAQSALLGDRLFVLMETDLLEYDVGADRWQRLTMPIHLDREQMIADGDRLVFASGSDENEMLPDRVLDPATSRWSTLPDDPLGPAFDRILTVIPAGLVLTGHAIAADPGADGPSLVIAARFDRATGAWTRLPASDQLGGWAWTWTGRRLLDPTPGGSDGGGVGNYGRAIPYGGILDPATGRWTRLPHAPKEGTGGWPVDALGGRFAAVGGWKYDDDTEGWTRLPAPRNAPDQPGSAVWAGDRLVVVGGIDARHGYSVKALSRHAWISQPGETLGLARQ